MKRYNIVFLITLLLTCNKVYTAGYDSTQYKKIVSKEYSIYSPIKVLSDSMKLEGYLIFEILRNPISGIYYISTKLYTCDIYFTSDLNVRSDSETFIYNTNSSQYGFYDIFRKDDSSLGSSKMFQKVFESYSNLKWASEKNNLYYLSTNIFNGRDINFYYSYSEDTIITAFKVSFWCALLKYDMFYYDKNLEIIGDRTEFLLKNGIILKNRMAILPISKTTFFIPVSDEEMSKFGFKKSNWFPDNFYDYK